MHRDDDHNLIEADLKATDDLVARALESDHTVPEGLVDRVFDASVAHLASGGGSNEPALSLVGETADTPASALPTRVHSSKWIFVAMAAGVIMTIGITMKFGFQSMFYQPGPNPDRIAENDGAPMERLTDLERQLEAEFAASERLMLQMHGEGDAFEEESTLLKAALIESEITMTAHADDFWSDELGDGLTADARLLETDSFDSF